jgi:hypothetical protein
MHPKRSEPKARGEFLQKAAGLAGSLAVGANSANEKSTLTRAVNVPLRAGEEIRTPDVQLGKLAFYH